MGNSESGSYQKRLARIPREEQAEIQQSFENMCRATNTPKKSLDLQAFQDHVSTSLTSNMSKRLFRGIQSISVNNKSSSASAEISEEQFVLFVADLMRGTAEEKSCIIYNMMSPENSEHVKGEQIHQFCKDLTDAVVHVLNRKKLLGGWSLANTQDSAKGAQVLASHLLSQLKSSDGQSLEGTNPMDSSFSRLSIENWLYKVPLISMFLRVIMTLGLSIMKHHTEHQKDMSILVPKCRGVKSPSLVSVLDFPSVMYLNSHLPSEVQHKWRLLFSTRIHGESFSQLCGHLIDQGPSVLVLKDSDGFIFGGFASQNWEVKPQFQGNDRCFLFSISPRLDVYTYTGYNDHYMYLNHGQQTMPNGLGMGGQHEYFGLWIDSNYGIGHSKAKPRCTTYNSPQLSAKEDFTIDAMEVWAVGDLPEALLAKNNKSILDVDPEARALLEMTGKTRQSDGLRNKPEDMDD
ncbi:MTOR-associated protein MEAK7 [Discoglossus pictus]